MGALPRIRDLHDTDIAAAYAGDPSAKSLDEIVFCYPGVAAALRHRIAHELYGAGATMIARIMAEHSHSVTGIDIHPGATIGARFFIDHGFTVIGETADIGDDVTIYQNVTLGGTNPSTGVGGKRHPTLKSGVVIGSGAQVLGPIIVGEGARVGANAVVTKDVVPNGTVVGIPARPVPVDTVHYSPGFVPYGTPCGENCDPAYARIAELEAQLETIAKQMSDLEARNQPAPKAKSA